MDDIMLRFNEDLGVWEERPEPYITIECETMEDFEYIQKALDHYNKECTNLSDNDPSLFECSECNWTDWDTLTGDTSEYNYCPNCGAKVVIHEKET